MIAEGGKEVVQDFGRIYTLAQIIQVCISRSNRKRLGGEMNVKVFLLIIGIQDTDLVSL